MWGWHILYKQLTECGKLISCTGSSAFPLGTVAHTFFFKHITHHEAYLNVREQGAFVGVIVFVLV